MMYVSENVYIRLSLHVALYLCGGQSARETLILSFTYPLKYVWEVYAHYYYCVNDTNTGLACPLSYTG